MRRILCSVMMLLAVSAIDARAQMSMGAFKGYLTGHVGAASGQDLANERFTFGGSVSVQEQGGWGAELDFGHASDANAISQTLDINTYVVNAAYIFPRGLVRPFGTVGAGVMQLDGCACNRAARTYDLALSAGGGAYFALHDMAGIRADGRYFFAGADHPDLNRPDSFGFFRLSVGATLMWDIVP